MDQLSHSFTAKRRRVHIDAPHARFPPNAPTAEDVRVLRVEFHGPWGARVSSELANQLSTSQIIDFHGMIAVSRSKVAVVM